MDKAALETKLAKAREFAAFVGDYDSAHLEPEERATRLFTEGTSWAKAAATADALCELGHDEYRGSFDEYARHAVNANIESVQVARTAGRETTETAIALLTSEWLLERLRATDPSAELTEHIKTCRIEFEVTLGHLKGTAFERAVAAELMIRQRIDLVNIEVDLRKFPSTTYSTRSRPRPEGRQTNCSRVVPASLAAVHADSLKADTFAGWLTVQSDGTEVADHSARSEKVLELYSEGYGATFSYGTWSNLARTMVEAGPGSSAILHYTTAKNRSHVTVVHNHRGVPLVVEAQRGIVPTLRDYASTRPAEEIVCFGVTHSPDRLLRVDEVARARELMGRMASEEFRREEQNLTMGLGDHRPPSVHKELDRLRATRPDAFARLDEGLHVARTLRESPSRMHGIRGRGRIASLISQLGIQSEVINGNGVWDQLAAVKQKLQAGGTFLVVDFNTDYMCVVADIEGHQVVAEAGAAAVHGNFANHAPWKDCVLVDVSGLSETIGDRCAQVVGLQARRSLSSSLPPVGL